MIEYPTAPGKPHVFDLSHDEYRSLTDTVQKCNLYEGMSSAIARPAQQALIAQNPIAVKLLGEDHNPAHPRAYDIKVVKTKGEPVWRFTEKRHRPVQIHQRRDPIEGIGRG